ncbi:MAG: DUF2141 domain-containing protein [Bacteroidota bacterium]
MYPKTILAFCLFCCYFSNSVFAQTDLTITVTGIEAPAKGQFFFQLYRTNNGFPKDPEAAAFHVKVADFGTTATHTFRNVPSGEYAITVMQDLNDNGEIDTNFIGMPKEPLGVSNMTKLGKPSFRKSLITLNAPTQEIAIKLLNQ